MGQLAQMRAIGVNDENVFLGRAASEGNLPSVRGERGIEVRLEIMGQLVLVRAVKLLVIIG